MVEIDIPAEDVPHLRQDLFVVDQILVERTVGNKVRIEERLGGIVAGGDLLLVDFIGLGGQGRYLVWRERIFYHEEALLIELLPLTVGEAVLQACWITDCHVDSPKYILIS